MILKNTYSNNRNGKRLLQGRDNKQKKEDGMNKKKNAKQILNTKKLELKKRRKENVKKK